MLARYLLNSKVKRGEEMYHIVISSHGSLSDGFLDTLSYFTKDLEQVHSIALRDKSVYDYQQEVHELIEKLEGDVLVMVDLFQGTPFKTFYLELQKKEEAIILSNVGFPQVLNAVLMQQSKLSEILPMIEGCGELTVTKCGEIVNVATEEDE